MLQCILRSLQSLSFITLILLSGDLPPILTTSRNLVKSAFIGESGHEETIFR
jgi:hypothetical protein